MELRSLGASDIRVSALGLGTMTWGEQNDDADAFAQLDLALDAGVNFVDTAEMYPVPPQAETQGRTETILGRWLSVPGRRARVVLATKVAGPGPSFAWIREGRTRYNLPTLQGALEGSLRRLRTDHVDLYQLHWPERNTNFFGAREYRPVDDDDATPPDEVLRALQDLHHAGKARLFGLSNETPWGLMAFLRAAELAGLPRIVSVQNPYSLLNRTFEIGMAEIAHRERVGLLAYSPLGMGVLTGKYAGGARPANARMTMFSRFQRYMGPEALRASDRYVALARAHGVDPAQLALAWILTRPFVTSALVGATTLAQLQVNLAAASTPIDEALQRQVDEIHAAWPNPAP
jgi:aryl-alcohol dehydrogenase-like predicted oxidoreductase